MMSWSRCRSALVSGDIKRRRGTSRRMRPWKDVQDVKAAYAVLAASELASVATAILSDEAQSEQLIPADIGRLVGDVRTRLQAAITLFRERYEGERERITENRITAGTDVPGNHSEHEKRGGIRAGCRPAGSVTPPTTDAETGAGGQLSAVCWRGSGTATTAVQQSCNV
ncbi:hypothetical protein [Escherichia coli]|uniref:hypothetical protein n=1 Tax=Escherichia coli TaxID=562 RepID=UPI002FCD61F7